MSAFAIAAVTQSAERWTAVVTRILTVNAADWVTDRAMDDVRVTACSSRVLTGMKEEEVFVFLARLNWISPAGSRSWLAGEV